MKLLNNGIAGEHRSLFVLNSDVRHQVLVENLALELRLPDGPRLLQEVVWAKSCVLLHLLAVSRWIGTQLKFLGLMRIKRQLVRVWVKHYRATFLIVLIRQEFLRMLLSLFDLPISYDRVVRVFECCGVRQGRTAPFSTAQDSIWLLSLLLLKLFLS